MNYGLLTWGGVVIILFSLFDMLDGQVARLGNMTSTFGAMYDSVLDRYCELFTLGGLSYYLIQTGYIIGALITFVALVGSIMVSVCPCAGRRSRSGMQGRFHAASRACGRDYNRCACHRNCRSVRRSRIFQRCHHSYRLHECHCGFCQHHGFRPHQSLPQTTERH